MEISNNDTDINFFFVFFKGWTQKTARKKNLLNKSKDFNFQQNRIPSFNLQQQQQREEVNVKVVSASSKQDTKLKRVLHCIAPIRFY